MASTSAGKVVLLCGLLCGLAVVSGCIFLDAQFEMGVDGGTDATLEVGILKSLAEQGEGGDPTAQITEGLAEGKWQQDQFDRDQWRVSSLKGHAGPGESLFTKDAEMQPKFVTETHLLSTVYGFTLPLPKDAVGVKEQIEADAKPQGEGEGEVKVEGMENADKLFGDLAALMMTGGDKGIRFAVTLPGSIISTNGETSAANRATWHMDLAGVGAEGQEALTARSRLVNWGSIGRMAPRFAAVGRYDLVPVLVAAVQRGVVPDPVTDAPLQAELDGGLYADILDIMVALDAAVGPKLANTIMVGLHLNADTPDRAAVQKVLQRVTAEDFAASVEKDLSESLIGQLGAP